MRSFFKRPSWARKGDEHSTSEFYRRAGQIYEDIIAANKEARESSALCSSESLTEGGRAKKRRHVSGERILHENTPTDIDDRSKDVAKSIYNNELALPSSKFNSYDVSPGRSDRSEQQGMGKTPPGDPNTTNRCDLAGPESQGASFTPQRCETETEQSPCAVPGVSSGKSSFHHDQNLKAVCDTSFEGYSDRKDEDVTVQILITSQIVNTKPLIIHRKMSQSLRDVRLAWCKRQNLSAELQASTYLSWKGRRLFDVTTCKSLGLDTETISFGGGGMDECIQVDDKTVRIHMEVVTEEIVALGAQRLLPVLGSEMIMKNAQCQESLIEIVLKCPGFDNFKTRVASNVPVSQLVSEFRNANGIPEGRDIYLVFDGDRLSPGSFLTDYEITNDDLVDVLIK